MTRNRIKQTISLEERLHNMAEQARSNAQALPPGKERDSLMRKARHAEMTAHLDAWLSSPGLQPPK